MGKSEKVSRVRKRDRAILSLLSLFFTLHSSLFIFTLHSSLVYSSLVYSLRSSLVYSSLVYSSLFTLLSRSSLFTLLFTRLSSLYTFDYFLSALHSSFFTLYVSYRSPLLPSFRSFLFTFLFWKIHFVLLVFRFASDDDCDGFDDLCALQLSQCRNGTTPDTLRCSAMMDWMESNGDKCGEIRENFAMICWNMSGRVDVSNGFKLWSNVVDCYRKHCGSGKV